MKVKELIKELRNVKQDARVEFEIDLSSQNKEKIWVRDCSEYIKVIISIPMKNGS